MYIVELDNGVEHWQYVSNEFEEDIMTPKPQFGTKEYWLQGDCLMDGHVITWDNGYGSDGYCEDCEVNIDDKEDILAGYEDAITLTPKAVEYLNDNKGWSLTRKGELAIAWL